MPTGKKVSTFRERFSQLVDESQKTIVGISKDLHMSNQTISAWKVGTRSPKEPTIITIANYFGVSVQWLMGFDVDRSSGSYAKDTKAVEDPEIHIVSGMMEGMTKEQKQQVIDLIKILVKKG